MFDLFVFVVALVIILVAGGKTIKKIGGKDDI